MESFIEAAETFYLKSRFSGPLYLLTGSRFQSTSCNDCESVLYVFCVVSCHVFLPSLYRSFWLKMIKDQTTTEAACGLSRKAVTAKLSWKNN